MQHPRNPEELLPNPFASQGLEGLNIVFEPNSHESLLVSNDVLDPCGNVEHPETSLFPANSQQPLAQGEPPLIQVTHADTLQSKMVHEHPLHLEVNPQSVQLPMLLRGSTILGPNSTLTDLAAYDHAWRMLQESYGDVGALIGKRDAFSCARDIVSSFVDSAAKHCFLSGPIGCGKTDVTIATAFLLLLCGKVQSIVVFYDQHSQSALMLNTMRMICDAATACITAADLPAATKSIVKNKIYVLSNIDTNTIFRCVPKSEAELWCSLPNMLLVWDAPLPVSSSLSEKLKQASCVLVVSCLPLSLAQASGNTDVVPMSKQSLELKMERLSEEITEIMESIKQQQLLQLEASASGEAAVAVQSNTGLGTDVSVLNSQMREKLLQLESQTLKAFCHQRAFSFTPFAGYRSLASYRNRDRVHASWSITPSQPPSTDAIHLILLQLQSASSTSRHCRIALIFLRQDCGIDSMKLLCASLGVQCVSYRDSPDSYSSSKLVVVLCLLGDDELPHIVYPKRQIALFFLEPCINTSQPQNSTSFNRNRDAIVLVQRQLCGFDSEFDINHPERINLYLPESLLNYISIPELTTDCTTPQSYRSFFHPICGSVTLKAGTGEAFAFFGNPNEQNQDPNAVALFSTMRRNFLCRRMLMLLLQNPNMICYHCGDGSVTIDELQHKEICSRLELCMALMYDPSCTVGVATECEESESTMNQIFKAATENRHYPSQRPFHIAWRRRFQLQGDLLVSFALVGWTFDVSCETAVFIANTSTEQPASQFESTCAVGAASTIVSLFDSNPPNSSSSPQSTWAKHRQAAEKRNFAFRQPMLEQEDLMFSRHMAAFRNELIHSMYQEGSFHPDSVWKAVHEVIRQEIYHDQTNLLLALQAPKGSAQREAVFQSLLIQMQLFILKSATTVAVHCENDDAIALRSRLVELALPKKFYGAKQRSLSEDVSTTEAITTSTADNVHNVDNVFAVDRILGQKIIDNVTKFRVRWEGYPPAEDTWEPADNIADIVLNEWKKKKRMSGIAEHCILNQQKHKGGIMVFRLRWKGFGPKDDTWEPEENIFDDAMKEWKENLASLAKSKMEASRFNVPSSVCPQPVESDLDGNAISRSSSASSAAVRTSSAASATAGDQLLRVHKAGSAPQSTDASDGKSHRLGSSSDLKVDCAVTDADTPSSKAQRRISAESAQGSLVFNSEDVFLVDSIVGQKMVHGVMKYRVRWDGFMPSEDTWEPADNIADIVLNEWRKKSKVPSCNSTEASRSQIHFPSTPNLPSASTKSSNSSSHHASTKKEKYKKQQHEPQATAMTSSCSFTMLDRVKMRRSSMAAVPEKLSSSRAPSEAGSTDSFIERSHFKHKQSEAFSKKESQEGSTQRRHVGRPRKTGVGGGDSTERAAKVRHKESHSKHKHSKTSSNSSLFNAESGSRDKRKREESPSFIEAKKTKPKDTDIRVGKSPDIFFVDRVVDEKMENDLKTYRVRWVGYSASDDTWEPASNISARVICPPSLRFLWLSSCSLDQAKSFSQVLHEWSQALGRSK